MFVIKSEFVSNIGNLTLFLLLIKDNEPAVLELFFTYNLYFGAKIFPFF